MAAFQIYNWHTGDSTGAVHKDPEDFQPCESYTDKIHIMDAPRGTLHLGSPGF